jgi:hypothetical protein
MTILGILDKYNEPDLKNIGYEDIIMDLNSVASEEQEKDTYAFEQLAFRLQPQHGENPWGNYHYGPQFTFRAANGAPVYSPAFAEVTKEAVEYWNDRISECNNPLLKLRYATLVWDFQPSICHKQNNGNLYNIIVDAALDVCNGDYFKHPVLTVNMLEWLFAFTRNREDSFAKVKTAYADFEKRHSVDDAIRYWASRFQIMLDNKKCFSEEEKEKLVAEHEARLSRLANPGEDLPLNPWTVKAQACLLADYYTSKTEKEEVKRVLAVMEKSFHDYKGAMAGMQYAGILENIQHLYRHYNLDSEAKRMMVDVQNAYQEALAEMQPQKFEFEIPEEVKKQADLMFGKGAERDQTRWDNFTLYFIPLKNEEEKSLKELAQKFPFRYIMGSHFLDAKGRPMAEVGSLESDFDGNLALHVVENMNLKFHFLSMAILEMLDCEAISVDKIMNNRIIPCPIFEEDRYDIIREALQCFMDEKYVLFSHLIIPQLEYAICNLVEMSGMSALKISRKGKGYQLKTLDDLLRMQPVIDALTEDGAYYLRLVLTNQLGLNLRNLMCHGIATPQHFGYNAAAWLLHVLFMLSAIRENGCHQE